LTKGIEQRINFALGSVNRGDAAARRHGGRQNLAALAGSLVRTIRIDGQPASGRTSVTGYKPSVGVRLT
jgi:hypothetical protein